VLPPAPNGKGAEAYYADPVVEIGHVHLAGKSDAPAAIAGKSPGASAPGAKVEAPKLTGTNFLPVGFVRSKLLGGIYAPTGGQAQSNPMPVILRVKDLAVLPNQFRANVRDCLVVGASYGDLSAERAYVRIELLSCIRNDGQALEVKAQGAVFDDDGKLGLRGRLISKQDKILANALLAGVVGGIGQGVQNLSSTMTVTPFGNTVAQPQTGQELRAGVGSGVGRALDRLANYQISLAEKVFPVIEVDSDREVDIAFTKGIELPVPLPELSGADDD
jgi:conjugal transfer pilus assembly protein TraB